MMEGARRPGDQVAADSGGRISEAGSGQPAPGTAASVFPPVGSGELGPQPNIVERLLVVPRDRRCPRFNGRTGIGIAEWIEEVQTCMRVHHLSGDDQACFIFDHLEGEAREEIRHRPSVERGDPARILQILQGLYGCTQSYITLQQAFFSREQQEGESLLEYSLALMTLMDRVKQSAPPGSLNPEVMLRDQFIEHVLDGTLCRELKQLVRRQPRATLLEVREEAMRWERDGRTESGRGQQCTFSLAQGLQYGVQGSSRTKSSGDKHEATLEELMKLVKHQQEQIDQLTRSVAAMQAHPPPRERPSQPARAGVCYRCRQPGHFARECRQELTDAHSAAHANAEVATPRDSTPFPENYHPLH